MDESNFPSNKQSKAISPAKDKKVVDKVITGTVKTRRRPLMRRFAETFIAEDSSSVGRYILFEVLIPAAKDLMSDLVKETVDRTLFGGGRSGRVRAGYRSSTPGGHVSYNRYSSGGSNSPPWRRDDDRPGISRNGRRAHNFDEIVLDTRAEANEVLDHMYELLSRYEQVTVSDLYDLVGLDAKFTDEKWGWRELQGSRAVRVHEGYVLDLPKTEQLD